ncbi:MAG: methionyl-tRNA formyltransferase [Bacillota bacterium]
MKIVFMGTPDFAVPSLKALARRGHVVKVVVTQPDRPRGRGKKVRPSPVKEAALAMGIPVYQPERVREEAFISVLRDIDPDVIVVVAFGQILPPEILHLPPLGCVNVHSSLLPRYRGAAPMQRAIMNGETGTGVTTMIMSEGLDSGDILLQASSPIYEEDNFGTLHDRLALLGSRTLLETLELMAGGKLAGTPQDHGQATYAPVITRGDEIIKWDRSAEDIRNQVRALDPWPGARTRLDKKVLKIWNVQKMGEETDFDAGGTEFSPFPGSVLGSVKDGLVVQCGDRPVVVREMQIEGGKRLSAADFLRGYKINPGAILGETGAVNR